MKRVRLYVAAGAVVLCAALVVVKLATRHPPIRIAALFSLTGADAAVGLGMRNAARLAVDETNRAGGIQGRKVELVEFDDGSDIEKSGAAATRLGGDGSVVAVVTGYNPEVTSAALMVLRDLKFPTLIPGLSSFSENRIGLGAEFRITGFEGTQQKTAARYAWETLGARTFACVSDNSEVGHGSLDQFRDGLEPFLGKVTGDPLVTPDQREFSALVEKIRVEAPQYVFFGGQPAAAAAFLGQLRAAGVKSWFQTASHSPSQEFIELAGDSAEGALAVFHGVPAEDFPEGRAFLKAYSAGGYSEGAGPYGIYAYASTQTLMQALDKSFLTRPSVAGALSHEGFTTALGPIKYFFTSSTYQKAAIYKVVNRRWTPVVELDASRQLKPYTAR